MTAQVPDSILYRGQKYELAGKNGPGLFDPGEHGMKPDVMSTSTACYRGYVCLYVVEEGRLFLDELQICLEHEAPTLFGVSPPPRKGPRTREEIDAWLETHPSWEELDEFETQFNDTYEKLRQPMAYTGGLLLARDFIEKLYVHMGFHPAWKYREVHELIFNAGELVKETDRSAQVEEFRREIAHCALEPDFSEGPAAIRKWIMGCFSQDYHW
jgi:hypothetical protein